MSKNTECLDNLLKVFCAADDIESDHQLITHYTKYDSALKILSSKTLWATDHRYLNDPLEVNYGVAKIVKRLDESSVANPQLLDVQNMLKSKLKDDQYHMLITSLVKHDDYLPCWRFYGGDGSGLAISFNKKKLAKGFKNRGIKSQISDVIYDEKEQIQFIDRLIISYLENHYNEPESLIMVLFLCLPILKHYDWKEEMESRLISPHVFMNQCQRFVPSELPRRKLVAEVPKLQYKLFEFEYREIEKVIVGPCLDYSKTKNRITAEILRSGLERIPFDIEPSDKKYNPWLT